MDVSEGLAELGRTLVAVVASGPKSILPVISYSKTKNFSLLLLLRAASRYKGIYLPPTHQRFAPEPLKCYLSLRSGPDNPYVRPLYYIFKPGAMTGTTGHGVGLGMTNGYFFGAPIPRAYKALGAELQLSFESAIKEPKEDAISKSGNDATAWLLSRIYEMTGQ